jgi:peptidoglycan/xylan/chitin deacetylase (PgdA/CDA1 family)
MNPVTASRRSFAWVEPSGRGARISEFDVLHLEPHSMMMIAMHPQMSGRPSRLAALEAFIKHALLHEDVWIGRCDQVTGHLRAELKGIAAAA